MSRLNVLLLLFVVLPLMQSDRSQIETMVQRLTSPEMNGRAYKSEGGRKAAEYIATRFQQAGLKPAAGTSYFQPIAGGGQNVAGWIEGTRKDAYLLIAAHYDAFGGPFVGARDSAAAVAVMTEIARLCGKAKPQRGILFLALDGEEQRQAGAKFYAQSPLVPVEKTELVLKLHNFGQGMGEKQPETMYVSGAEFSPQAREAAGKYRNAAAHLVFFGTDVMQWPGNQHAVFPLGKPPVLSITNGVHYTMHSKQDLMRNVNFAALEKHATTLSQLVLDLANTSQKIERQTTPVFDADETNEWSRLLTRLREQVVPSPANAAGQEKIDDILFELKRFQGRALQEPAAREAVILRAANIAFFMAHPAAVDYKNLLNAARNADQAGDRAKAREAYQKLVKFIEEEYRQDEQTAAEFRSHLR